MTLLVCENCGQEELTPSCCGTPMTLIRGHLEGHLECKNDKKQAVINQHCGTLMKKKKG